MADDGSQGLGPPRPPEGGDGPVNLGRALALVVVAVVLGVLLLQVGSRPPVKVVPTSTASATLTPSTTTTAPPATTTTVPHSSVSVVVANGTEVSGVAADYSSELQGQGWAVGAPIDTTAQVSASTVYYATGEQSAAAIIATALGLKATAVQALTTATPVQVPAGTQVVVVVGPDLAANPPATTTTG